MLHLCFLFALDYTPCFLSFSKSLTTCPTPGKGACYSMCSLTRAVEYRSGDQELNPLKA